MSENTAPKPELETNDDPYNVGFPFNEWVSQYQAGEISPEEFVSEMEFDGFDGDLIEFL